jgi:hypothetical protein
MQFKLAQRAVVEDIFRGLDMPTRSELDETYQVIHDLKMRGPPAQEGLASRDSSSQACRSYHRGASCQERVSRACLTLVDPADKLIDL